MAFDINDPETKAGVKALVDAAVLTVKTASDDAATALQANNAKLLKELRDAKKNLEIDPVKHAALEDRVTELDALLATATKDAAKATKDAATQLDTLTKQLQSESGFTSKLLVDNGLNDALVKAGVPAHYLPAVKAMLAGNVKIVTEGDVRKAMMGDKPMAESITAWAQTDEGKHFITAPANSGGGAGGGKGAAGTLTTIAAGDKTAFGANLAELAKGTKGTVQVA